MYLSGWTIILISIVVVGLLRAAQEEGREEGYRKGREEAEEPADFDVND